MLEKNPKAMQKKPKKDYGFFAAEESPESDAWILTYADMMTLLMTFFVFLLALSTQEPTRMSELMHRIGEALGTGEGAFEALEEETLETIMNKMDAYIKSENLTDKIFLTQNPRGVVVYGGSDMFFESGEAIILEEAQIFLKNAATILKNSSYKVHIEGHTDDLPLESDKFPSNWELSASRAAAVARFFIETGDVAPSRLIPGGYAEFKPRFPATPENRAKNNRIELLVLREKF